MSLKIEWCTELYPTKEEDNFGVAGDFAVIRLDELDRWLEGRHLELEQELIAEVIAGNTYKESMIRHALAEVSILLAELDATAPNTKEKY